MLFVLNFWFLGLDRGGKNEGGNWLFVDSRLMGWFCSMDGELEF